MYRRYLFGLIEIGHEVAGFGDPGVYLAIGPLAFRVQSSRVAVEVGCLRHNGLHMRDRFSVERMSIRHIGGCPS